MPEPHVRNELVLAVCVRKTREGLEDLLVVTDVERLHAVVVESFDDVALSPRLQSGLLQDGSDRLRLYDGRDEHGDRGGGVGHAGRSVGSARNGGYGQFHAELRGDGL